MAQQEISDLPEDAREAKILEEREKMRTYDRGRETLPSLRLVQLEPSLPEPRSPNESAPLSIHNPSSPLVNISDDSSHISSVDATRPTQYASRQSRIHHHFPQIYPHGAPSPLHSDAEPRDSSPISPPPVHLERYADRRTPQSEELTPQAAESHLSTGSFSIAPSPHSQHLGTFECDLCTAPAFQTQSLLE